METVNWEKTYQIFHDDKKEIFHALRRGIEHYPYVKEILIILAAGTFISAAILMPGLHKAVAPFIWQGRGYRKKRFRQTLQRLYKQKAVEVVETKDGPIVKITQRGITKALKYKLDEMKVRRKVSWDRKWRIVVFDISEKKKRSRDEFRERLKQLGFFRLQESVFVHAFPCFDEVEFLRQIYGVDRGVTYILAQKVEGQENLKSFFKIA